MAKQNTSQYVVLGILSIKPMSGYDIKIWIEESVRFFWKISYNQIYPALKSFVKNGFATCTSERRDGGPERKVYTLTDKGLETLREWLIKPIDFYSPNGNELLLKLFFGAQISIEDNIKQIVRYKDYVSQVFDNLQRIKKLIDAENTIDPSRPYRMAALKQGISTTESLISWCDQTIAAFKSQQQYSDIFPR